MTASDTCQSRSLRPTASRSVTVHASYWRPWTQQPTLDSPLDPSNGNRYAYADAAVDPIAGPDATGNPSRVL